jgi:hypothetical protein
MAGASEVGVGSTFNILLPLISEAAPTKNTSYERKQL